MTNEQMRQLFESTFGEKMHLDLTSVTHEEVTMYKEFETNYAWMGFKAALRAPVEPICTSCKAIGAAYKIGKELGAPVERQAPEWQPIETAPKDKRVLVWSGQEIYAADWAKNIFTGDEAWIVAEWGDDREQVLVRPTHWKPTGAAPAGGETGEA